MTGPHEDCERWRNGRVHGGEPFSSLASAGLRLSTARLLGRPTQSPYYYMKDTVRGSKESEPIGIVISRGSQTEQSPAICAYVWGAAPELKPVPKDNKAA